MEPTKPSRKRLIANTVGVILILSIIAAILYPAFAQSGGPRKSICLSRIKQLTTATLIYTDDNNNCFPPHYTFDGPEATRKLIDVTLVYSKNKDIYLCPLDDKTIQPNQEGLADKMSYVHSLALRGIIPEFSTGKRVLRQSDVENVATTPFLRDPIRGYGLPESINSQPPQDG